MQVRSQDSLQAETLEHYNLMNNEAYEVWKQKKIHQYPQNVDELVVFIKNPVSLFDSELDAISECISKTNMCVYQLSNPEQFGKSQMKALAAQVGLNRLDTNICADEDSITSLQTRDSGRHVGYIPYSSKKLSWHTDGYYNKPDSTIRGMMLHCVNNAPTGGENQLLDPEILYIQLRDENPDYIKALMDESALTIPANEEDGVERAAQTGPVFSLDNQTKSLHLRYTARTRSIEWAKNSNLQAALKRITEFLNGDSSFIFKNKLKAGQGILCNNVLHNRTAFEEDESLESKRLIYRARFYDRISI